MGIAVISVGVYLASGRPAAAPAIEPDC